MIFSGFLINVVVFQAKRGVREKKRNYLRVQIYVELCNRWPTPYVWGSREISELKNIHLGVINITGISSHETGKIHQPSELERRKNPMSY